MSEAGDPEQPYANALVKKLALCLPQMTQDVHVQRQMFSKLFLMVTARIQRLVKTYLRRFHRSCSIIHPASFDPNKVSIALLAAVTYIGGLYSEDISERGAVLEGLDLLECMVFSSKTFMTFPHLGRSNDSTDQGNQSLFDDLQAGCLVVVAQHCFGNHTAKARAMETRFGELIRASASACSFMTCIDAYRSVENLAFPRVVKLFKIERLNNNGCGKKLAQGM